MATGVYPQKYAIICHSVIVGLCLGEFQVFIIEIPGNMALLYVEGSEWQIASPLSLASCRQARFGHKKFIIFTAKGFSGIGKDCV